MASNDSGEKTEEPTPRKLIEAREQGNIARSQDLAAAAILLAGVLTVGWFGEALFMTAVTQTQRIYEEGFLLENDINLTAQTIANVMTAVGRAMLPIIAGLVVVAVIANVAQTGLVLSTKKLEPKLNALNPIEGVKKLFKGANGFVSLGMNIAKLALVGVVVYLGIRARIDDLVALPTAEVPVIFSTVAGVAYSIALRVAIILLLLALIDYIWQRYRHKQKLKMSKQEVKDEMRRMDGDPQIKQKRRQIQLQKGLARARQAVPGADVVVTNPTHVAVALKYDADMVAPRVVAKGQDLMAFRIREIAVAHGVPILERPPLARQLFRTCEVGDEIPEDLYAAVAEILAYVYELNGRTAQAAAS